MGQQPHADDRHIMLTHIVLQHYILIDHLELSLEDGLTCVTGETGAGKSIWVNAIALALGARCEKNVVKPGHKQCSITLIFCLNKLPEKRQRQIKNALSLQKISVDEQNNCVIRRCINQQGRSYFFMNDTPCSAQTLKKLSPMLLQLSGQHQQQQLREKEHHISWLDPYTQDHDLAKDISHLYTTWQQQLSQLKELQQQQFEQNKEMALWQYQQQELATFDPKENEWAQLQARVTLAQQNKDHGQQLHDMLQSLSDNDEANALLLINQAQQTGQALQQQYAHLNLETQAQRFHTIVESLEHARIEIEEAAADLRQQQKDPVEDEHDVAQMESRLQRTFDLARKHRIAPEDLYHHFLQLTDKINQQTRLHDSIALLEKNVNELQQRYMEKAQQLSILRQHAAKTLAEQVTCYMQQLAMPQGVCQIEVHSDKAFASENGIDRLHIKAQTNPQQSAAELKHIASGGELSRIALALEVITAKEKTTPTLIFDEIDSGMGGQTAVMIGKLLKQLSSQTQVICITHLAQVAAYASTHVRIDKQIDQQQHAQLSVTALSASERVEEIARMVGGESITTQTRQHAKEMIALAE